MLLLAFNPVARLISVYSMRVLYVLQLWHANLPLGSLHLPRAFRTLRGEVFVRLFVCTPTQWMTLPSSRSIILCFFVQQLLFYPQLCFFSVLLISFEISVSHRSFGYICRGKRDEDAGFFTRLHQGNLSCSCFQAKRIKTCETRGQESQKVPMRRKWSLD